MTEEFSFDVDEESIKQLESVIDEEVIKIHNRFDNGTETLEDLLYYYPHIVLKCELKNKKEIDLDVVERKYYERLAGRAKLQDTEINKLNNVIDRMAKKLSQVPMYHFKSKSNIYSSDNIDLVAMSVDEIKDYFMDMERRGEYE